MPNKLHTMHLYKLLRSRQMASLIAQSPNEGSRIMRRPLSKNKTWRMTDILHRERVYDAEAAARESAGKAVEEGSQAARSLLPGSVNRGFAASAAS